ncbi:alpha/beta hydrolase [Bradyrhizobium sp. Tv2a-2]|uniref:alpha/beta fold hydrolase n=1 Tax=Bradyrhizobium sp. Tv2a-2 TaxID=113395 RepID=UPI0003FD63D3|nr:alpha/beta hydrolase [Bradyrhizobium sp. Tv2a-2]
MSTRFAKANGINLAYRVQGGGPPLVLIMGYRLNSTAWPATFIERLAQQFTVITLDNRGTGQSDKPVEGYVLANMARDVCALLDELGLVRVNMLGYSMGGAIAQEFVRQFPDRVNRLILCATMAGGAGATYAETSVVRVMRDLDGLSPEQAARRIWNVTYAPGYLAQHRKAAEEQMRREIELPTPLHAADLQFQAFAEFNGSEALSAIRTPTLILTGDLDPLISPQNSRKMAALIAGAKLIVIPGGGHRIMWEATDECVSHILHFLGASDQRDEAPRTQPDTRISTAEWLARWPATLASLTLDSLTIARQSMMAGSASRFGDGKPIVLIPPHLGSDLVLLPLSLWLKALGYRPVAAGLLLNLGDSASNRRLLRSIDEITARIGRKAVLLTHSSGLPLALRAAEDRKERVSDVIALDAPCSSKRINGVRVHLISSGWSALPGLAELPQLLRNIDIELIDTSVAIGGLLAPQLVRKSVGRPHDGEQ